MLNAKHGIYLPSSRKCGNQCLVHSTGRVAAVAIIWLQYAGKYREAAFVTSKLREEKLYREISTISLDPKAQPVVPSEKDGKCKHTLKGNKDYRTLHPYFGSTVEGVCKQPKISHEVACHKQSSNGEVLGEL